MKYVFSFLFLFFSFVDSVYASNRNEVNIYFFHSDSCSHCKEEEKVLRKIEDIYDNVVVYRFEIHDEENASILKKVGDIYLISTSGVPVTVIGDTVYTGYQDRANVSFIKTIEYYSLYPYHDRVMELLDESYEIPELNSDVPSLDEFMNRSYSYSLFGMKLDKMDVSIVSVLLGAFSVFHVFSILSFLIVFFVIKRKVNRVSLLVYYFIVLIVNHILEMFDGYVYFILIMFLLFLLLYFLFKNKNYLFVDMFVVMAFLVSYLREEYFFCLKMFRDILFLNVLSGIEKISYYGNYFVSIFLIDLLLMSIFLMFFLKKVDS